MISFIDITKDYAFQDKTGYAYELFGVEIALKNKPLDFIYESDEVINTFVATSIDLNGRDIETFTLATSLIESTGTQHVCVGLTDYSVDLDGGIYYFLVNGRYKSESFAVVEDLIEETLNQPPIAVSGLPFYDNTINTSWSDKEGSPDILFGSQYVENSIPVPFVYNATDSASTFVAIKVDMSLNIISQTSLSTDLISSNGSQHVCNGASNFASNLDEGIYYFSVNGRYESEIFLTIELDDIIQGVGYDIIGSTLIVYS